MQTHLKNPQFRQKETCIDLQSCMDACPCLEHARIKKTHPKRWADRPTRTKNTHHKFVELHPWDTETCTIRINAVQGRNRTAHQRPRTKHHNHSTRSHAEPTAKTWQVSPEHHYKQNSRPKSKLTWAKFKKFQFKQKTASLMPSAKQCCTTSTHTNL